MARIHRRTVQKDLHNPDNHNGVITHLEPDILEREVKRALGSITKNKASEVMKFQLNYIKSWKMILWKCCSQYASKFGTLSSGHRNGKGQFIPIPKKGNAKEFNIILEGKTKIIMQQNQMKYIHMVREEITIPVSRWHDLMYRKS